MSEVFVGFDFVENLGFFYQFLGLGKRLGVDYGLWVPHLEEVQGGLDWDRELVDKSDFDEVVDRFEPFFLDPDLAFVYQLFFHELVLL